MTSFIKEITGSEIPHVPEGTYTGTLLGVEEATTRFGQAFKWHWAVQDGSEQVEITQMTSTATSGGSKAGGIVRALRGKSLKSGERLPVSEIAGQQAVLEITIGETGWNRVESVDPAGELPF
jgi:hypothetical protein